MHVYWSVCQYSCVSKIDLKKKKIKITPVCENGLENFQVGLKSTSEAFEFTQKSNIILRVVFLQNHFAYQSFVSVQISEVFQGSYYYFPWLSPQIKLEPLAKKGSIADFN